jgi:glycerophosphoryl diester phosphodiesterase
VICLIERLPRPTIFAHRGASAHAPENTLAAFLLAIEQGADAIELDAKLTADRQVVVIHDPVIDRVTPRTGRVKDLSLAALRQLDVGSHFDVAFRGEPIPTLIEVFEIIGRKIYINVELTNYTTLFDALPDKVADLVKLRRLTRRVMFSSFNPIALLRIHRQLPGVPLGLLARPGSPGNWARGWLGKLMIPYQALHVSIRDVNADLVKRTHDNGRRLHVYTVNRSDQMRHLFNMGVDGIFTDDPNMARQVLATVHRINR